ncbi:metalloregulator ArsR/SmtB family transcription factor [Algibacter agarivorans]|uniref:Metalloregulator ArsR/SmtB family transcription factor n=2 Tax=Algibacter agarivorans TaxID=1109741 RepID=A0ABP9GDA9_9FLAO
MFLVFFNLYNCNIAILLFIYIFVNKIKVMGASKLNIYSESINKMAIIAKVFAHPARISILQFISKQKSCICNDIVDEIGLSQPTISQHLKVINDAGLLKGNFEGKSICYCLNLERFQEFQSLFNSFFNKTTSNCC